MLDVLLMLVNRERYTILRNVPARCLLCARRRTYTEIIASPSGAGRGFHLFLPNKSPAALTKVYLTLRGQPIVSDAVPVDPEVWSEPGP